MDRATVVSGSLTSTPALDNSWKTAGNGDYNGDGKSDILWREEVEIELIRSEFRQPAP
jgi:hypothetical protein